MSQQELVTRFNEDYWRYYLSIEKDFLATLDYVELSKSHFKTYSRMYLNLLQTIGSEVDVCAKSIGEYFFPNDGLDKSHIAKWGYFLQQTFPDVSGCSVETLLRGITLTPWKNWKNEQYLDKNQTTRYRLTRGSQNPSWWTSYNKTKHRRKSLVRPEESNYESANLDNVLNALAGLYVLEILMAKALSIAVEPDSKLFKIASAKE